MFTSINFENLSGVVDEKIRRPLHAEHALSPELDLHRISDIHDRKILRGRVCKTQVKDAITTACAPDHRVPLSDVTFRQRPTETAGNSCDDDLHSGTFTVHRSRFKIRSRPQVEYNLSVSVILSSREKSTRNPWH
jgi:hypothetical protein